MNRTQALQYSDSIRSVEFEHQRFEFIGSEEFQNLEYSPSEIREIRSLTSQTSQVERRERGDSPVQALLRTALPPLTADQERALFQRMNFVRYLASKMHAERGSKISLQRRQQQIDHLLLEADEIRHRLALSYLRLVISVARRLAREVHEFQELVSDGTLILMSAIDKFDYSRGFRFSTYLTHSIQRALYRGLKRRQTSQKRFVSLASESLAELAQANREEFVEIEPSEVYRRLLDAADSSLEDRELSILHRRFGTKGESEAKTLREIAAEFGMSKERVRQIQIKAMAKLKKIAQGMNLATTVN